MINTVIFSDLISEMSCFYKRAKLCGRLHRPARLRDFTPFSRRIWFKYLNDNLTTEEFIYAVEQAILHSFYMPTPEELVAVVKGRGKFSSATANEEKERTETIRQMLKKYE